MTRRPARFDRLWAARFLAALLFCYAAAPAFADAKAEKLTLKVAGHPLSVEVAATEPQRERGLMFRRSLGRDAGMLFVFDDPGYYAMWMKNTLLPLSVAFLDGDGVVLNVLDMEPQTLESHASAGPAVYAIETNVGWFASHHVKAGDKVTGLPKRP